MEGITTNTDPALTRDITAADILAVMEELKRVPPAQEMFIPVPDDFPAETASVPELGTLFALPVLRGPDGRRYLVTRPDKLSPSFDDLLNAMAAETKPEGPAR